MGEQACLNPGTQEIFPDCLLPHKVCCLLWLVSGRPMCVVDVRGSVATGSLRFTLSQLSYSTGKGIPKICLENLREGLSGFGVGHMLILGLIPMVRGEESFDWPNLCDILISVAQEWG